MTVKKSADVDPSASISPSASIWHLAQVREGATVASGVTLGRGSYVGPHVVIGAHSKIQNYALIYDPAVVGRGVFIGPSVVLTNDLQPRAVNRDGSAKSASDWNPVGVIVEDGASIGAGSVCVAPLTIGAWSMIGSGSIVTRDVPPHALVFGSPARQVGWVCFCGKRLLDLDKNLLECPDSCTKFHLSSEGLINPVEEE
jgi:UDP-2-acetamido-3-amino-2,3-dideoxy-glucuronate N-acetyltransferase